MDTTFFGRYFGILVLMDSITNNVVSHYFVRTAKDIYYKLALNRLREKGCIIQSITCDGRRAFNQVAVFCPLFDFFDKLFHLVFSNSILFNNSVNLSFFTISFFTLPHRANFIKKPKLALGSPKI
ncbi:hypothetical protein [Actinobacillus porcinus]|uniref:hypothetical protein n=1 Tax=Actinobacillus porcinus TaxID=51048 RepID=UPI0023F0D930|nr:hypothetical protein [Actinobacillus porcinus]MDD7545184.1 hypothetical protein [Actinobacillus porcinus]MDY5848249.1 hypothetical protein [Actinobacillus porcinus]